MRHREPNATGTRSISNLFGDHGTFDEIKVIGDPAIQARVAQTASGGLSGVGRGWP